MPPVWQELGPVTFAVDLIEVDASHRATRRRDPIQLLAGVDCKEDHAFCVPRASSRLHRVSENLHGSACGGDLFERLLREERDEFTVERPERIRRSLGFRQRHGGERIERPNPEPAGSIRRGGDERQAAAVGRNAEVATCCRIGENQRVRD